MSTQPKTEVAVTTTVRLTIKGHAIEMSLEELKALHAEIGKAIGIGVPSNQGESLDMFRKIMERLEEEKRRPQRPWPAFPPKWPQDEAYLCRRHPLDPPWRPTCTGDPLPQETIVITMS